MTRIRRRAVIVAATATLMLMSACGNSDSDGDPQATTGASAKVPPGDPIVVGMICSCAGDLSSSNLLSTDAANAWAQSVNEAGGINGHAVKLVTKDDTGDPTLALQQVKEMVEQDHIIALIGDVSVTTSSWEEYITSKGIPVIGGNPSEAPFSSNPNFFLSGSTLPVAVTGNLIAMQEQGLKHWGALYCAEAPVCATLGDLVEAVKPVVPGIEISTGKVAGTSPSYTPQCLAFQEDGVDSLWVGTPSETGLRVVDSCAKLGYTPKNVTHVATTGQDWLSNPNVEGAIITSPNANYQDDSVPGVKAFLDAMDTYYPGDTEKPQFSGTTIFAWIGGKLFEAAATAADIGPTSKPADVKEGLYMLEDETLDGLAPPLNFTEGEVPFPECYFLMSIEGGEFTSPAGADAKCLTEEQLAALKTSLGMG